MESHSLDLKRVALANKVKIAGGVVGCLIVAPFAYFILQGLGALVALAIAGFLAFTVIQLAPWYADVIANWRMKLIMAEANKNPIETMNNIYVDNMNTIAAKDEKIKAFSARLGDYKDKMAGFVRKYPEEAPRYQEVADKMTLVLNRQIQKQRNAKIAAKEYRDEIEKAQAIYDMALAANDVVQLGGDVEKHVFQDIKKQVAFDAVNHKFNMAVAELTMETDVEPDFGPALPGSTASNTVDSQPVPSLPVSPRSNKAGQ
jgi:hypothetical protein